MKPGQIWKITSTEQAKTSGYFLFVVREVFGNYAHGVRMQFSANYSLYSQTLDSVEHVESAGSRADYTYDLLVPSVVLNAIVPEPEPVPAGFETSPAYIEKEKNDGFPEF